MINWSHHDAGSLKCMVISITKANLGCTDPSPCVPAPALTLHAYNNNLKKGSDFFFFFLERASHCSTITVERFLALSDRLSPHMQQAPCSHLLLSCSRGLPTGLWIHTRDYALPYLSGHQEKATAAEAITVCIRSAPRQGSQNNEVQDKNPSPKSTHKSTGLF